MENNKTLELNDNEDEKIDYKQYLKKSNEIMLTIEKFILKHNITLVSFKMNKKKITKIIIIQIINDLIENCEKMNKLYKLNKNYYIINEKKITKENLMKEIIGNLKNDLIPLINVYQEFILINLNLDIDKKYEKKFTDSIEYNTKMLIIFDISMNFMQSDLQVLVEDKIKYSYKENKIRTNMFKDLNSMAMDEFLLIDQQNELIQQNVQLRKLLYERHKQIEANQEFIQHECDEFDYNIKKLEENYEILQFNHEKAKKDTIITKN